MVRYVVLVNFTDRGAAAVSKSMERAAAFRNAAEKVGATVESAFWTLGESDGLLVLRAPDEATATALVLDLAKAGNVRTRMLRAFDEDEFKKIVDRLG
ncbi:MAG: GYD domain-containing protein [Phycisphaerae bacterium]